jgi:hypothetical protein
MDCGLTGSPVKMADTGTKAATRPEIILPDEP